MHISQSVIPLLLAGLAFGAISCTDSGNDDDDLTSTSSTLPLTTTTPTTLPVSVKEFSGNVALSESLHDRFWAVAFDAQNRIYAAGHLTDKNAQSFDDQQMIVVRFNAQGQRDSSFGSNGIAAVNIAASGTAETARGIVIQSQGKIVIAGNVETNPNISRDTDVALARFTTNGVLDTTFGTNGITRLNFSIQGTTSVGDIVWGIDRDANDKIVVFAGKKAEGRNDRDRVVARLTADGAIDAGFATNGVYTLDVSNLNDNPRNGAVQPDGKIISAGYTPVGGQNRPILLRLSSDGTPDASFGTNGLVNLDAIPAPGMAEAYGAALQGTRGYITAGYGRATSSGTVDMVSFRYTQSGQLDSTWGTNSRVQFDLVGLDDRGRNVMALPDERILIVGSSAPATGQIDAMIMRLTSNGTLDTSWDGKGYKLYSYGAPDEAFYGVALSPDKKIIAVTGYRAGGGEDDDATLVILPVE